MLTTRPKRLVGQSHARWMTKTGALRVFAPQLFFCDIAAQHRIKGVVVHSTAQSEHGIPVFFQPPGGGLGSNGTENRVKGDYIGASCKKDLRRICRP